MNLPRHLHYHSPPEEDGVVGVGVVGTVVSVGSGMIVGVGDPVGLTVGSGVGVTVG